MNLDALELTDIDLLRLEELIGNSPYPIHLTSEWLTTYVKEFNKSKAAKFLIIQKSNQEKYCGFLPLEVKEFHGTRFSKLRRLSPLGTGPSDFFDIACEPGYEKKIADQIVYWLKKNWFWWDSLRFDLIPESSKIWRYFYEVLKSQRFQSTINDERFFYMINVSENWDDYQRITRQHTHDLQNRLNRARRDGIHLRVDYIGANILEYWDHFYQCYKARRTLRDQSNSFEINPAMESFMKSVILKFEKKGMVQLSILYGNEDIWAYQLDWIHRGIWYHYMPTFDQRFEKYSPGKILLSLTVEEAFHRPEIHEFNFMRGQSAYKSQFATHTERYISINVENPYSIRNRIVKLASLVANFRDLVLQSAK